MVELHIPRLGRVVATFVSPLTQAIAIINSELAEEDIKERETPMALVQAP